MPLLLVDLVVLLCYTSYGRSSTNLNLWGYICMKKFLMCFICVLSIVLCLLMTSCGKTEIKNKIDGNMKTYYEMTDGSWTDGDYSYKFRLEIKGRLNNAVCDSVYVYLSNIPDISFEQAWKASGLSSNSNDYFSPEDAVLVEIE